MSIEAINWAWSRPMQSPFDKVVLAAVANHANERRQCYARATTLGAETALGERAVRDVLKRLAAMGALSLEERPGLPPLCTVNLEWPGQAQPRASRPLSRQVSRPQAHRSTPASDAGPNERRPTPDAPVSHAGVEPRCPTTPPRRPAPETPASDTDKPLGTFINQAQHAREAADGCAAPGNDLDEEGKRLAFDVERCAIAACDIAGLDRKRVNDDRLVVEAWVQRWNIDTQILPAIRGVAARTNYGVPQSLNYFDKAIKQFVAEVGSRPSSPGQGPAPSPRLYDGRPWDKIIGDWKAQKEAFDRGERQAKPFWIGDWGSTPDKSGCHAPREVLVRHGYRSADA